jgi:hypothetical protein
MSCRINNRYGSSCCGRESAYGQGCLRLNCVERLAHLSRKGIELSMGQALILHSEGLEIADVVKYFDAEYLWVA